MGYTFQEHREKWVIFFCWFSLMFYILMVNNFYIVCLFWCSLVKRGPPENEHEVYSYDETTCDSQVEMRTGPPGRLCLQLSSENLLLNGYRAKQFGMPLQILVDCTYSMTTSDDFATMLIGVMDLSQQFHVVVMREPWNFRSRELPIELSFLDLGGMERGGG